ncbi:hypothetical protein [Vibrio porteresiae]|uniref:Uncharacterized protein n=1 Tax=Vibrio porteresiae DSM 19223 TaxID=1123496 RepID=A0ABZ0Q947_9VIBR|nr:hypothetical protein [Vibrio porteresiae]WPC72969.1 hypothetical protein R8Z52_12625 [Vibrio porteresiae DSM 19223]
MRHWELQELAGAALGLTEDQTEEIIDSDEDFDTPLLKKFNIDFEQFSNVAEALLKLTPVLKSPLSGELDHAFVKQVDGGYLAIIKTPAIIKY